MLGLPVQTHPHARNLISARGLEDDIIARERAAANPIEEESLPVVRPVADVMQVHSSYIVTQDEHGLVIIDQHALHERILRGERVVAFETLRVRKDGSLIPIALTNTSLLS